jgi:hypothetical protein
MRRLIVITLPFACALSCGPTEQLKATVEVTGGTFQARQTIARAILEDLTTTMRAKVQRRLPGVNTDVLNGLQVSVLTSQTTEVPTDKTTSVFLACSYMPDESVNDREQKRQVVEACREEAARELAARTAEKRGS